MARQCIDSLQPQMSVDEIYRVTEKQMRANRQGNMYLLLQLADRTGSISGMKWNANQIMYDSIQKGDYLQIEAMAQLHNGNMQLIINKFDLADARRVDAADFDRMDREAVHRDWQQLQQLISTVQDPMLRQLAQCVCDDPELSARFQAAPAGIKAHHAHAGGLLMHVVNLMQVVDRIAPCYPQVDRDMLMVGAMFHDIGKLEELIFDGELTYSDSGQMVGHLVQGVQMLGRLIPEVSKIQGRPFPQDALLRLEHMIVSHHGSLEHGSPRIPMTLEAILLHSIDDMDAKINAATELAQSDRNSDSPWTAFNPTLGRKIYKPSYVATNQSPKVS